jgi:hypothetical protein
MGGGSQETKQTLPKFAETGVQQTYGMGRDVATQQATYVPTYGPTVAALSPQEQLSGQYTDMAANAFGMPTVDTSSYMPQAMQYEGGIQGYSPQPLVEQSLGLMRQENPGYTQYTESFGIDPMTGAVGSRAPESQPVELEMQSSGGK